MIEVAKLILVPWRIPQALHTEAILKFLRISFQLGLSLSALCEVGGILDIQQVFTSRVSCYCRCALFLPNRRCTGCTPVVIVPAVAAS